MEIDEFSCELMTALRLVRIDVMSDSCQHGSEPSGSRSQVFSLIEKARIVKGRHLSWSACET